MLAIVLLLAKDRDMENKVKKIIWAINPADQAPEVQENIIAILQQFYRDESVTIEPVTVYNNVNFSVEEIEARVQTFLQQFPLKGLSKPHIIRTKTNSITGMTLALENYANKSLADMIILGTHGRSGLPRFFLGSFAETLLLRARQPILTVGPEVEKVKNIKHILFVTDLESESLAVFPKVLALAKQMRAKLTIFHTALMAAKYMTIDYGFGSVVPAEGYFKAAEEAEKKQMQDLVAHARKHDIDAHMVLASGGKAIAVSAIELAEKQDIGMIALAAMSGRAEAAILGSIARQIIRISPYPVWVMRSRFH